ncbi:MAG: hypothetical protein ACK515_10370 [bacterium]|jgi:hypothetical protein
MDSYKTFTLLLDTGATPLPLEVIAVSIEAAMADVNAAYVGVTLLQWGSK